MNTTGEATFGKWFWCPTEVKSPKSTNPQIHPSLNPVTHGLLFIERFQLCIYSQSLVLKNKNKIGESLRK